MPGFTSVADSSWPGPLVRQAPERDIGALPGSGRSDALLLDLRPSARFRHRMATARAETRKAMRSANSFGFSELERAIPGVTQKMLIQQLRDLESDGIVRRVVHPVVPPKVEYSLTPGGEELCPALDELLFWAQRWKGQPSSAGPPKPSKATQR